MILTGEIPKLDIYLDSLFDLIYKRIAKEGAKVGVKVSTSQQLLDNTKNVIL